MLAKWFLVAPALRHAACVLGAGLALLGVFAWLYLPLLVSADGSMGGDYALFLPNLLAGYFWYQENGALALPWFSPGACGGVPFFPDANVPWFSVPQLLTLVVPPSQAIRITLLGFAYAGFLGTYILLRQSFRCTPLAAFIAATLFMFNGFFVARMLVGHLTFHPFMLLPLFCACVLPSVAPGPAAKILRITSAGLLLATMLQAGMVHGVPAVLISAAMLALVQALRGGPRFALVALPAATGLGALLAAGKLAALAAFVAVFPRDNYRLSGFASFAEELLVLARSLFIRVPDNPHTYLSNLGVMQQPHEFEVGVTAVPLLLMLAITAERMIRRPWPDIAALRRHGWALGALLALASLPLLVNWYEPHWNAVLKQLPYFRSSSNLLRWNLAYILPVIVLGGLAFDALRWPQGWGHVGIGGATLAAILMLVAARDLAPYLHSDSTAYASAPIDQAWQTARQSRHPPPIVAIAVSATWGAAARRAEVNANNALTVGYSHRQCYQPMFGYGNENLPLANLRPAPVMSAQYGLLNLKNPACYLFPRENRCLPGAMFEVGERAAAEAFAAWKPFPFVIPAYMQTVLTVNLIALVATLLAMLGAGGSLMRGRFSR